MHQERLVIWLNAPLFFTSNVSFLLSNEYPRPPLLPFFRVLCLGFALHFLPSFRNPLIPAHNVLRAVSRAADRDAKHRQFLLRMQVWL